MTEQSQDDLALVLRRISALSQLSQPSDTKYLPEVAEQALPVLTDVYAGEDVLGAVEIEELLAPYYSGHTLEQSDTAHYAFEEDMPDQAVEPEHQAPNIKFLPASEDEAVEDEQAQEPLFIEPDSPQLLLARQELANAVIADMQPLITQAIQEALVREIQGLAPKISTEVEQALAERLRERVTQALQGEN